MITEINPDKIYIATGYTDMRNSIDGLAAIISTEFELSPFENILFVFCGRSSKKIKALYWQKDGFVLLYKRLENGNYNWPRNTREAQELSHQQFRWLMEGLTIYPKRKIEPSPIPKYVI